MGTGHSAMPAACACHGGSTAHVAGCRKSLASSCAHSPSPTHALDVANDFFHKHKQNTLLRVGQRTGLRLRCRASLRCLSHTCTMSPSYPSFKKTVPKFRTNPSLSFQGRAGRGCCRGCRGDNLSRHDSGDTSIAQVAERVW